MDTNELNYEINIQKKNLDLLTECLKKINTTIQNNNSIKNFSEFSELYDEVNKNISNSNDTIANLEELKTYLAGNMSEEALSNLSDLIKEISNTSSTNVNNFLYKYIKSTSLTDFLNNPEEYILNFDADSSNKLVFEPKTTTTNLNTNSNIYETSTQSLNTTIEKENKELKNPIDSIDNFNEATYTDNKVLFISEKQNKVFLPYTVKDLNRILKNNKSYRNMQEIIDTRYTVPLHKYRNLAFSRFREGFALMRKKEKASFSDSFDLALDLLFNRSLNPAVITACRNLRQLDFYLDCMELNELDKFTAFEIKYDYSPTKI